MRRGLGSFVLLAACSSDLPADLGEHGADRMQLQYSPALVHLAAAMDDPGDLTVEDLFRARPGYDRPPDPSALFAEQQAAHEAQGPLARFVPLRVLSFNTGLLDRWYPFAVVRVPQIDARRERSPAILLGDDWDVLLLQEVWDEHDVQAFEQQARHRGYRSYAGSSKGHEEHGLLILVREELIDPDGPDEWAETTFELQRDVEKFPGPGVERGYLSWRFRHAPSGRVIQLLDAHTTAFPELAYIRDTQARELGLAARRAPDHELVILGGDINGGAYYPHDQFGAVDGEPVRDWWRNAQAYALLLHYGGFQDAHVLAGRALEVELLDALPAFDASYQREPFGDRTLCEDQAGGFTATDCNSLYFEQYAGTEYPARIDFIMIRDRMDAVRVLDGAIEYTEPIPGESFELSDHYGVSTTLLVSSP